MNNAPRSGPADRPNNHSFGGSRSFPFRLLLAFTFLAFFAAAAAANDLKPPAAIGTSQSFAIADFDGDGRADIATVGPGPTVSSAARYWIRIQLSSSEGQSIQLLAPAGGLLVEPRDINDGNHYVNLVLTTAWSGQPVAVLINDGRGRFSRVEPTAYPEAFTRPEATRVSFRLLSLAFGTPSQSRSGVGPAEGVLSEAQPRAVVISRSGRIFFLNFSLLCYSGRAPPSTPLAL